MPIRFEDVNLIENSAFFDAEHLEQQHPDITLSGMTAAQHYLQVGGFIGRNPGPGFDSAAYLATYLDVAARGENPLWHYERHGRGEGRNPMPKRPVAAEETGIASVDVVVPVYNALEDVKACLQSLVDAECNHSLRALVVNDGSDEATTGWLREACIRLGTQKTRFELIEHDTNSGYTKAVNTGLKASDAPFVVTLNSDTIVTAGWLDGLIRCLKSDPTLGVVGPLSNAASWQNVPNLYGDDGKFAINALPEGMNPEGMADFVRYASRRLYPRSTFVNGFCFMIRRAVLDAVGYMDEGAFPTGYGEENDFCIRAQDAGFSLAFADDVYVYHAKSKSFGSARREELSKAGGDAIRKKHGERKFGDLVARVAKTGQMDKVRRRIVSAIADSQAGTAEQTMKMLTEQRVMFLLPVKGGGGGAHSVVQEVTAMRRLGVDAKIAVRDGDLQDFMKLYGDVSEATDIFLPFRTETLLATAQSFDVVVATIFTSVKLLEQIVEAFPWILPAYYAQDYEPLFFDQSEPLWQEAFDSYTRIPGSLVFAKTVWICREIEHRHDYPVTKVDPSIDHEVYNLSGSLAAESDGKLCITAMIRPRTPRRGAARTMELLGNLKARLGTEVTIRIFGCDVEAPEFKELDTDFDFIDHGILTRREVAALLRSADVFIDLSDYQAFGRTSLEAMACGTLAVLPQAGGGEEYAVDGVNALVVDSFDVAECFARLVSVLEDRDQLARLQFAGVQTAANYSPRRAAMSELQIFAPAIVKHRALHPKPPRADVSLLPLLAAGEVSASGHSRVLCPYQQDALAKSWQTAVNVEEALPEPGTSKIVILQQDLPEALRPEFGKWSKAWRAQGGRLIYDVNDGVLDPTAQRQVGAQGDARALSKRILSFASAADLITVSTQYMADVFSEFSEKTMIAPDFLDDRLWTMQAGPSAEAQKRNLKIGFIGMPAHADDAKLVQDAMREIEKRHHIEIEVIGAFQKAKPLFGQRIGWPRKNTYPDYVSWLHQVADWDITIVPLEDTPFSQARGNIRFLESAALNTAIVCSDTVELRKVARDGRNCLMVQNDTAGWIEALSKLITDEALRARLAETALHDVRSRMTVQSNFDLYDSVLQRALHAN